MNWKEEGQQLIQPRFALSDSPDYIETVDDNGVRTKHRACVISAVYKHEDGVGMFNGMIRGSNPVAGMPVIFNVPSPTGPVMMVAEVESVTEVVKHKDSEWRTFLGKATMPMPAGFSTRGWKRNLDA